jgi:2-iminobutanoate/2-iminopropanoate deaminase
VRPVPEAVVAPAAPTPAGSYSAAVRAGQFVFLAGQTPRTPNGTRLTDRPFDEQVVQALDNLQAVAHAAGGSLAHAVRVGVFLRPGADPAVFDRIYRGYVGDLLPARTITVSELAIGDVEVDAILHLPATAGPSELPVGRRETSTQRDREPGQPGARDHLRSTRTNDPVPPATGAAQ